MKHSFDTRITPYRDQRSMHAYRRGGRMKRQLFVFADLEGASQITEEKNKQHSMAQSFGKNSEGTA